jgi:inorganic pyrophosphatase
MSKSINAAYYDRIPAFPSAKRKRQHTVNVIIETPKRSCDKYSLVPEYGLIAFYSALPQNLEWPHDYGFVPQTLADDGDPIDVLLINPDSPDKFA